LNPALGVDWGAGLQAAVRRRLLPMH